MVMFQSLPVMKLREILYQVLYRLISVKFTGNIPVPHPFEKKLQSPEVFLINFANLLNSLKLYRI